MNNYSFVCIQNDTDLTTGQCFSLTPIRRQVAAATTPASPALDSQAREAEFRRRNGQQPAHLRSWVTIINLLSLLYRLISLIVSRWYCSFNHLFHLFLKFMRTFFLKQIAHTDQICGWNCEYKISVHPHRWHYSTRVENNNRQKTEHIFSVLCIMFQSHYFSIW